MYEVLILITTESNKKIAKNIARLLIKNKLAFCVSIKQIDSIYTWEDNIEETKEFEITIKSKPQLKDDLIMFLQRMTSYEIPQILYKKFSTEGKYKEWVSETI